jgi:hypothetical protein
MVYDDGARSFDRPEEDLLTGHSSLLSFRFPPKGHIIAG